MSSGRLRAESVQPRISTTSLQALGLPRTGTTYDLSSGWWAGMPMLPAHPPFQLVTFRTPAGVRNQQEEAGLVEENDSNLGFISELMIATAHSGTHIDALAHCTCGPDNSWHGGHSADRLLGDFGPMRSDASELPNFITRGVMFDIPALLGVEQLDAGQGVGRRELEDAAARQKITVEAGDAVMIRTGQMKDWPDAARIEKRFGCGLTLDGAEWLAERGARVVGGDTVALEMIPSRMPGVALPVHRFLIREKGIPIMEWVFLEDLARDGVYEFLFLCLPLPIKGATGSMVRPLAIV